MQIKSIRNTLFTIIILAINHPSGNLKPSEANKIIMSKMQQVEKLMDIQVLEHLILIFEGYYSFIDETVL